MVVNFLLLRDLHNLRFKIENLIRQFSIFNFLLVLSMHLLDEFFVLLAGSELIDAFATLVLNYLVVLLGLERILLHGSNLLGQDDLTTL